MKVRRMGNDGGNGMKPEYALYKGDTLLSIGTISEIAEQMGVKRDTILYYRRPVYQKRGLGEGSGNRRVLVKLD